MKLAAVVSYDTRHQGDRACKVQPARVDDVLNDFVACGDLRRYRVGVDRFGARNNIDILPDPLSRSKGELDTLAGVQTYLGGNIEIPFLLHRKAIGSIG